MKYYFIYKKGESSFYAFTDKKKLKNEFLMSRDKDLFISVKREITKEQLKFLLGYMKTYDIVNYVFTKNVQLPITVQEKMEIEFVSCDANINLIACSAKINPEIFNERHIKILEKIGYIHCYNCYINGGDLEFTVDRLMIFLKHFGDTIDLNFLKGLRK